MSRSFVYMCKHLLHPISRELVSCDVREVEADSDEMRVLVQTDYYEIESKNCPICKPAKTVKPAAPQTKSPAKKK